MIVCVEVSSNTANVVEFTEGMSVSIGHVVPIGYVENESMIDNTNFELAIDVPNAKLVTLGQATKLVRVLVAEGLVKVTEWKPTGDVYDTIIDNDSWCKTFINAQVIESKADDDHPTVEAATAQARQAMRSMLIEDYRIAGGDPNDQLYCWTYEYDTQLVFAVA
jgi:hypothetical protein